MFKTFLRPSVGIDAIPEDKLMGLDGGSSEFMNRFGFSSMDHGKEFTFTGETEAG